MSQSIRVKRTRVGDDVATYCGRCKAERTHTVAAMNSDTAPAEVICRTCNTKHRFRRPAGDAPPRRPSGARADGTTAPRAGRAPRASDAPPASAARPYSPAESYAEGEWIAHPRYGVGGIRAVRGDKIDVSFDTGVRTLIHAGQ